MAEPEYKQRLPNSFECYRACTDCGWSWVWWRNVDSLPYCKYCNSHNGYYGDERVELDADKLFEFLGCDKDKFDEFVARLS
jgi:hypothetical protein